MNRRRFLATFAVAACANLAVALVPAQAMPLSMQAGVTKTEIRLGMTSPHTGAASPGYNKIPGAVKTYFDYVNANGGVNGRKLTLLAEDDQYVPTQAVAKTNKLILQDRVFALVGTLGTANNLAIAAAVNPGRRGIPVLFVATGFSGFSVKKNFPTTFAMLPSYIMEAKIMAEYIRDNYPGKKLGLLYQDDDFGSDALVGFRQAELKFDVSIAYASGAQGVSGVPATWITRLQSAGAEVVVLFGVSSATGAALVAAARAQYAPQWILGSVGGDATTLRAIGVPVAMLNNAVSSSFLPSTTDTADEYIKLFQDIYLKAHPTQTFDNNVLVGMNTAFLTVQAIKAAGKNPTRKSLIAAIQKQGSTFAGAGLTPLNFSTTSHVGYNGFWFGKYTATGDLKPTGGVYTMYTTDSGNGAIVKSTYVRPAMPVKGLPN